MKVAYLKKPVCTSGTQGELFIMLLSILHTQGNRYSEGGRVDGWMEKYLYRFTKVTLKLDQEFVRQLILDLCTY